MRLHEHAKTVTANPEESRTDTGNHRAANVLSDQHLVTLHQLLITKVI